MGLRTGSRIGGCDVRWLALLPLVYSAACEGTTECCLVDSTAEAVLVGVVRDLASDPLEAAEVGVLDVLGYDCVTDVHSLAAVPAPAVSGPDGTFSLRLFSLDGGGLHCVDVVVRNPPSSATDTLLDVQVQFRHVSLPTDTTSVVLVWGG